MLVFASPSPKQPVHTQECGLLRDAQSCFRFLPLWVILEYGLGLPVTISILCFEGVVYFVDHFSLFSIRVNPSNLAAVTGGRIFPSDPPC